MPIVSSRMKRLASSNATSPSGIRTVGVRPAESRPTRPSEVPPPQAATSFEPDADEYLVYMHLPRAVLADLELTSSSRASRRPFPGGRGKGRRVVPPLTRRVGIRGSSPRSFAASQRHRPPRSRALLRPTLHFGPSIPAIAAELDVGHRSRARRFARPGHRHGEELGDLDGGEKALATHCCPDVRGSPDCGGRTRSLEVPPTDDRPPPVTPPSPRLAGNIARQLNRRDRSTRPRLCRGITSPG